MGAVWRSEFDQDRVGSLSNGPNQTERSDLNRELEVAQRRPSLDEELMTCALIAGRAFLARTDRPEGSCVISHTGDKINARQTGGT